MFDPNDETFLLSRRTMMMGGAALGAAGMIGAPSLASAATTHSEGESLLGREGNLPTDHSSRLAMLRRMRMRTDDGMVFWFFRGRNYAQQGANLIPLCELNYGSFMKITNNADGSMSIRQFELGMRAALGTGPRSEQIYNPITDQMIDLPFAPVGPLTFQYDAENNLVVPEDIGGTTITVEHVPEVYYQLGNEVSFQTHSRARAVTPGKEDRVLNDMSIITSPLAEAIDPSVTFASARAYGGDVTDFARWLQMPPGAGTQTLRSVGEKYSTYEQMPADWRDALAAADPEMAADPIGGLDREMVEYRN